MAAEEQVGRATFAGSGSGACAGRAVRSKIASELLVQRLIDMEDA
jgi:hypothetical protein